MNNIFITRQFDWGPAPVPEKVRKLNLFMGLRFRLVPREDTPQGRTYDWGPPLGSRKMRFLDKIAAHWGLRFVPAGTGSMSNIERRMNLYHLLDQVLFYKVPGDVVELGCHAGRTSALMQQVIDQHDPARRLHVYDSFEGLPDINVKDGNTPYHRGELTIGEKVLIENMQRYGLRVPEVHRGWFKDTLPNGLPEKIAFAHLDGDLYTSILTSLQYVYPKLSKGGVCLIDDYADPAIHDGWNKLPGVKKACDEYLAEKPEKISLLYAGEYTHGFFRKL